MPSIKEIKEFLRKVLAEDRRQAERRNGCAVNIMFMDLLDRYGVATDEVNTFQKMMNKHFNGEIDFPLDELRKLYNELMG